MLPICPFILKEPRRAKLSLKITAWLRQRLLFELLCLSKDTSFILLGSLSTPFVIVRLNGIRPAFVAELLGAVFSVFGKARPRKAWNQKKGQEEGKLFPGALQCVATLIQSLVERSVQLWFIQGAFCSPLLLDSSPPSALWRVRNQSQSYQSGWIP